MQYLLQSLVNALSKHTFYPADTINDRIREAKAALFSNDRAKIITALENLYFEVPRETDDKDWMDDELKNVMQSIAEILDNQPVNK